jgi:hypothetical protein
MAKMFYNMEETQAVLGKSEDEIRQLVRDKRLREFRDGNKLMFKTDAVDQLKAELGGQPSPSDTGDAIELAPEDSVGPLSLADSKSASQSASGSVVSLADTGASPSPNMADSQKGDTAMDVDLGMSGTSGGIPSPGRVTLTSGSGLGGSTMGGTRSGSGISVFSADEVEHADPAAQTAISTPEGDINLEGIGSGSGLLDLTRESDDTSLGAELLDEIAPPAAGSRHGIGDSTAAGGSAAGEETPRLTGGRQVIGPATFELPDPMAPAFGGAALGAFLVLLVGAYVLVSSVVGAPNTLAASLASHGLWMIAVGGLIVSVIFFIVGLILGKMAT